jgi:hypothetical protein
MEQRAMKLNYLGVPVWMNGRNLYIPSLSYVDFKQHYEFLTSTPDLAGPKLFEYFDTLVPIIGAAVRRNYSEITDQDLTGWLDMTTLPLAVKAVQSASGITPVSEAPETVEGE